MNNIFQISRSAFLAGFCVGIAGLGYLAEKSIIGAVMFSFGLLTVVHYKLKLYTGTAGFIMKGELCQLLLILVCNIFGTLAAALMLRCSPMNLQSVAQGILVGRLSTGPIACGALAIGCGFIMTTSVQFARQGKMLPLLFGVPLFITCGFPHCMADAFYYLSAPTNFLLEHSLEILPIYLCIVLGNFLGCNLYRLLRLEA